MAKLSLVLALLAASWLTAQCSPFHRDVLTYFKTGVEDARASAGSLSSFTCETCKVLFAAVRWFFDKGFVQDDIVKLITDICIDLDIEDRTVCTGIVPLFKDEVLTVFDRVGLSSDEACNIVIGDSCGKGYDPWRQKWNITIPGDKPPVNHNPPKPNSPTTGVLHITDIHYDPLYTPGLTNDCHEPLCCRPPNAKGSGSTAAGFWGDYKCDVPYWTLVNLMQNLKKQSDMYEWVYWTGDLPAHNVWSNSREGLVDMLDNITTLMTTYFGNKTVFPSFGNHEGMPVNSFPPPFITGYMSLEWLYNASAERWAVWLDKFPEWHEINATIRKGGYYIVSVRENLKIISLQTNYCNTGNYWLLINSTDPAGQLKWLVDQLLQAEKDGDKVHIIGHIAPGLDSCNPVWALNYHKIVNRFESTIVSQFFGHTHHDSIKVYYDEKNTTRATNIAYIGQSVTTYQNLNLGYRFFLIDGDYNESTSCVVDHINYYMDLNKTSNSSLPVWQFEYSALSAYRMPDLQPQSWANLVKNFEKNNTLFMEYYHHDTKQYSANTGETCGVLCECDVLCQIVTTVTDNHGVYDHCSDLTPMIGNQTYSCNLVDFSEHRRSREHC